MLWSRHILLPWLLSTVSMYVVSYLWHGLALTDLQELAIPLGLYLALAAIVYLVIGLILTIGVHKAVQYEYVSLKGPFPLTSALMGTAVGFFVYLVIFVMGMTFTKHGIMHVVVDIVWQMFEQGVGGLAVSLGIIWDMHKRFLEQERAN
ncbi:MAG: hypothetical protein ACK46G_05125 [Flavobacteriales bacterium]|jgi:hypothetical protein